VFYSKTLLLFLLFISNLFALTTTEYTYNANDRLLQQGGTTYEYDSNGNLIKESLDYNTKTYSYNAKDKLSQITTDTNTIKYEYNIDGIRVQKNINDSNITTYLVDSNRDYAQVLKEYNANQTIEYTYGHDLLSQTTNDITYNYHYDALGSTRNLSNQNGEIISSYDYEAYGKLRSHQGDVNVSYLYSGEQYNPESQNYYLRAREYNPTTKRFTQQDRYEGNPTNPLTLNKYLYANANPTNMVDPTGYYSMASVTMAMNVRSTLQNIQLDTYSMLSSNINAIVNDESLFDGLMASVIGFRFLMRFSPKLKKVCQDYDKRNSFDSETLIATAKGLKAIKNIQIGDKVWAYNENNQTTSLQEVVNLIQGTGLKQLTAITLENNETIIATNNHPIYSVNDNNWSDAKDLQVNDILLDINKNNLSIRNIQRYTKETTVYNLTVANDHTYFVGNSGVLGHNMICPMTIKWKGFSRGKLKEHYDKHVIEQKEFGDITQTQYLKIAKQFANEKNEHIQDKVMQNIFVRFDPKTGRVFAGHTKTREIRTFYIDDGRGGDPFETARLKVGI